MKKNIAVVFGGFSAEHDISVLSGKYISSVIDRDSFNVYSVLIDKDKWTELTTSSSIDKSDFSIVSNNVKIKFDAVVIEIHGNPGENGILQSYFDLLKIPYIGCNALTSALTFSKFHCNNYLRPFNVKMANSILVSKNEDYKDKLEKFINENSLPFFIKPNAGGSSFGTTKINEREQINKAITDAFEHSDEIIIEQFLKGRELTCGVVKTDEVIALTPIEVKSKNEFFDYEAKYNSSLNEEIIPAPVSGEIIEKCKKYSVDIYKYLGCKGIVRVDYILKDNELYFLELNSVPGMTSESLVPKMLRYDKINITELLSSLIKQVV